MLVAMKERRARNGSLWTSIISIWRDEATHDKQLAREDNLGRVPDIRVQIEEENGDVFIRIHADGFTESSTPILVSPEARNIINVRLEK